MKILYAVLWQGFQSSVAFLPHFQKPIFTQYRHISTSHSSANNQQGNDAGASSQIPAEVRSRIEAFREKRKASPPAAVWKEKELNPVLNYLGLDPLTRKQKEKKAKALPPDELSYQELERLGFSDLVEPIMKLGGYVAVSSILGIPVQALPKKAERVDPRVYEKETGLMLGAALEEQLSAASTKGKESTLAFATTRNRAATTPNPLVKGMPFSPEVYPKRASSGVEEAARLPTEKFTFGLPQRVYCWVLFAITAFAWGRATDDALQYGLVAPEVQNYVRVVSLVLLTSNAICAPLCARLASERDRGIFLWTFKGALLGPIAAFELQSLLPRQPES